MRLFWIGLLTAVIGVFTANAGRNSDVESTNSALSTVNPQDPVEQEFQKIMAADDAAQEEVDRWIRENQAFAEQGAASPPGSLNRRIRDRFEPVRKAYEDFLRRHPDHSRARVAYASFLSDTHDEDAAREQLELALKIDTNNPAIYNNLANIYGHTGPVKKAFEFYDKAIDLNPNEPVYYQNFGTTVYLFRKDAEEFFHLSEDQVFAKAFTLYSNAMRLDPSNFPLASDVAQTYYGIRPLRTEDALRAWTNALQVANDDIEREGVYIHFARIKLLADRFDEARRHLRSITNSMYADLKQRLTRNVAQREDEPEVGASGRTTAPATKISQP